MTHDKIKEFSEISDLITQGLQALLQAQELLLCFICKECELSLDTKHDMLNEMNQSLGIKHIAPT